MLTALAVVVLLHLALTVAHGSAHASAGVQLGPAGMAFVLLVIAIGPLAGLAWLRFDPRGGARVIAAAMTGAFLFGLVNHFVLPGADRVDHVVASSRVLFQATAALLAITEAAGAALGIVCGWRSERRAA